MEPSQVRRRIMHEHERFLARLGELETISKRIMAGEARLGDALRHRAHQLVDELPDHTALEDAILAPALREVDAWGAVRADRLLEHHERQREDLAALRTQIAEISDVREMAKLVLGIVEDLRDDIHEEERELLSKVLLRDDPIGVNVETG